MYAEEVAGDLLKGSRTVIPKALQDRATQLGHVGHQGIEKTKALLREKIWYPGKVKTLIENCVACQAVGASNPPESIAPFTLRSIFGTARIKLVPAPLFWFLDYLFR